jgi:hypothetical protein
MDQRNGPGIRKHNGRGGRVRDSLDVRFVGLLLRLGGGAFGFGLDPIGARSDGIHFVGGLWVMLVVEEWVILCT